MACGEMRKRHFNDKTNATRLKKTLKNVKMWNGRQKEDHEIQLSSRFVTWRRRHNVQTKKAPYYVKMFVKYCFKTSYWNTRIQNDKE